MERSLLNRGWRLNRFLFKTSFLVKRALLVKSALLLKSFLLKQPSLEIALSEEAPAQKIGHGEGGLG